VNAVWDIILCARKLKFIINTFIVEHTIDRLSVSILLREHKEAWIHSAHIALSSLYCTLSRETVEATFNSFVQQLEAMQIIGDSPVWAIVPFFSVLVYYDAIQC
jgi:hypothetical protein